MRAFCWHNNAIPVEDLGVENPVIFTDDEFTDFVTKMDLIQEIYGSQILEITIEILIHLMKM